MAVASRTIIQKMMKELQYANETQSSHQAMVKHVANVKLLCELLLDEEGPLAAKGNDITATEMKAMMGETKQASTKRQLDASNIDHDDANGKSIFDF